MHRSGEKRQKRKKECKRQRMPTSRTWDVVANDATKAAIALLRWLCENGRTAWLELSAEWASFPVQHFIRTVRLKLGSAMDYYYAQLHVVAAVAIWRRVDCSVLSYRMSSLSFTSLSVFSVYEVRLEWEAVASTGLHGGEPAANIVATNFLHIVTHITIVCIGTAARAALARTSGKKQRRTIRFQRRSIVADQVQMVD